MAGMTPFQFMLKPPGVRSPLRLPVFRQGYQHAQERPVAGLNLDSIETETALPDRRLVLGMHPCRTACAISQIANLSAAVTANIKRLRNDK
jgi:hypothetical protein